MVITIWIVTHHYRSFCFGFHDFINMFVEFVIIVRITSFIIIIIIVHYLHYDHSIIFTAIVAVLLISSIFT